MSGKANPYDNAKIEPFFRTLKVEEIYMFEYETYAEVLERIPYFIEEVYNRKRLHFSLGYMPPEEFENINNKNIKGNESQSADSEQLIWCLELGVHINKNLPKYIFM